MLMPNESAANFPYSSQDRVNVLFPDLHFRYYQLQDATVSLEPLELKLTKYCACSLVFRDLLLHNM